MASTIAATGADKFSELLAILGETVTVALHLDVGDESATSLASSTFFDSSMRIKDTTTVYATGTAYTAVVQVVDFDSRTMGRFDGMGIKGAEVVAVYFRTTVTIEEGDKVTTSTGHVYTVRWAPQAEDSYKKALCVRNEGMELSG